MDDVVVADKSEKVISTNKSSTKTRLKSIKEIEMKRLGILMLRRFCASVGLKGIKK